MEAPSHTTARSSFHRRSAKQRREQRQRAEARTAQRLLAGLTQLSSHRGSQPTVIGAALRTALASSHVHSDQPQPHRPLCRHYATGNCTWGAKCRFAHPPGASNVCHVAVQASCGEGTFCNDGPTDASAPDDSFVQDSCSREGTFANDGPTAVCMPVSRVAWNINAPVFLPAEQVANSVVSREGTFGHDGPTAQVCPVSGVALGVSSSAATTTDVVHPPRPCPPILHLTRADTCPPLTRLRYKQPDPRLRPRAASEGPRPTPSRRHVSDRIPTPVPSRMPSLRSDASLGASSHASPFASAGQRGRSCDTSIDCNARSRSPPLVLPTYVSSTSVLQAPAQPDYASPALPPPEAQQLQLVNLSAGILDLDEINELGERIRRLNEALTGAYPASNA